MSKQTALSLPLAAAPDCMRLGLPTALYVTEIFRLPCRSSEESSAADNAASALGKVIEFRRESISDPSIVQAWLGALPLFEDTTEAAIAHAQLLRRVEANDPW